jgi:hypothetical protein
MGRFNSLVLAADLPLLVERANQIRLTKAPLDVEVRFWHPQRGDVRWLRLHGRVS